MDSQSGQLTLESNSVGIVASIGIIGFLGSYKYFGVSK